MVLSMRSWVCQNVLYANPQKGLWGPTTDNFRKSRYFLVLQYGLESSFSTLGTDVLNINQGAKWYVPARHRYVKIYYEGNVTCKTGEYNLDF